MVLTTGSTLLRTALGGSHETVPDLELSKWYEGLLNFFDYAEDSILFLLE